MASMHDSVRFKTTVYAAIELSKKSWVVAIARPDRDRPSIHRIAGGNLADLIGRLRKTAGEKQRIVVSYEAGYDGFWLARSLAKIGIDYPAHHADCLGSKAGDLTLALCRNGLGTRRRCHG